MQPIFPRVSLDVLSLYHEKDSGQSWQQLYHRTAPMDLQEFVVKIQSMLHLEVCVFEQEVTSKAMCSQP